MINFQDRTFKYGNRKEAVLLMPGVLWEFYYSFICPLVANTTSCAASVFEDLVSRCPYLSKSKIHKGVINDCVIFLFIFVFQFYKPQTLLAFFVFSEYCHY